MFADEPGSGEVTPESLDRSWDQIKTAEKGRLSVTDGVPLGQPALSLAAKLQRRALRGGFPVELLVGPDGDDAGPRPALSPPSDEGLGERLWALVAEATLADVEGEALLRTVARRFRDKVLAAERRLREQGVTTGAADAAAWRAAWSEAN